MFVAGWAVLSWRENPHFFGGTVEYGGNSEGRFCNSENQKKKSCRRALQEKSGLGLILSPLFRKLWRELSQSLFLISHYVLVSASCVPRPHPCLGVTWYLSRLPTGVAGDQMDTTESVGMMRPFHLRGIWKFQSQ